MAEFGDHDKEFSAFPSNPDRFGLDIIVRPLVFRDAEADVDLLLLTLGLERGCKILDLPCGEGFHAGKMTHGFLAGTNFCKGRHLVLRS